MKIEKSTQLTLEDKRKKEKIKKLALVIRI